MYYIVLFVIVFAAAYLSAKTAREDAKEKFDVRQVENQMKGYRLGFLAMVFLMGLYAVVESVTDLPWFTPEALAVTVIAVGVSFFASYCIATGAYERREKTNIRNMCCLFAVVGVMNLWLATTRMMSGEMIVDGKLAGAYLNLVGGIVFLVISIAMAVRAGKLRNV